MIICKYDKPNYGLPVRWSRIFGRNYLFQHLDTIFIRSNDSYGIFKYECTLWNETQKLEGRTFIFTLKRCEDICIRSDPVLLYSPQVEIHVVDLRRTKTRQARQPLAVGQAPLSEPNIHYYFIAVGLSVALAIFIVVLCIMCYEPYERGASEVSIEDESVQANIKSPPCTDLYKMDGEDDLRECKEFKKTAYDCTNGLRRVVYTIEDMTKNEAGDICPINPPKVQDPQNICPMNNRFRDPVYVPCPPCPNFPDPNQPPLYRSNEHRSQSVPANVYVPCPSCPNFPDPNQPPLYRSNVYRSQSAPPNDLNPPFQGERTPGDSPQVQQWQPPRERTRGDSHQVQQWQLPIGSANVYPSASQPNIRNSLQPYPSSEFNNIYKSAGSANVYPNASQPVGSANVYPSASQPNIRNSLQPTGSPNVYSNASQPYILNEYGNSPQPNTGLVYGTSPQPNVRRPYQIDPRINNCPVFVNAPQPNNSPISVKTPLQIPKRAPSENPYYSVIPGNLNEDQREVEVSYSQRQPGHYRSNRNPHLSSSLPTVESSDSDVTQMKAFQKNITKYSKNRVLERRPK